MQRVHTRIRIRALVFAALKYAWASLSTFRRKLRRNNTRGLYSILLILSTPPPHYPRVLDTIGRSHLPVSRAFSGAEEHRPRTRSELWRLAREEGRYTRGCASRQRISKPGLMRLGRFRSSTFTGSRIVACVVNPQLVPWSHGSRTLLSKR